MVSGDVALPSGTEASETSPLSVAELDRRLRRVVESSTVGAWVQGEIGGLKIAASGHAYFALKDEHEDAMIDAVAYRDSALRAQRLLQNGARVVVRGKATVWAPRGKLQLVVDAVRPAGRGALLEALEKLKLKLAAEGLFDAQRKRPVPRDARAIGVVTSSGGAVIHDIIQVAFRRASPRILLAPAVVQGEEAAASIVAALDRIERVRGLDVIIIGRGGGSIEDLMAFNDERVVRRVAACRLPIVSAVGHEVDVTLTDLAADARAATPSQAAEMVVADAQAQLETLLHLRARLRRAMRSYLSEDRAAVERLKYRLGDPRRFIHERQQRLDDLMQRSQSTVRSLLASRRAGIDKLHRRLAGQHPRTVLVRTRGELGVLRWRLGAAARQGLRARRQTLGDQLAALRALSPLAVLARGYAIATGADGVAVRDAAVLRLGDSLWVRMFHGSVQTQVVGKCCEQNGGDCGATGE
ncbi:MAG: exodeoxyribonuclease VII large subunit [Polyangiaceae bacterium]|jgi:exodeoxyribonuclease VII large subunit|nr:exodeoxyribonuclease VII large subunit [Polyangiaceae bacterium]